LVHGYLNNGQKKKKGKLDLSLEKRLEDVGVLWDVFSEKWESNYRLLVKFQQREGHSNVPTNHTVDGIKLGTWLSTQRTQKKKGKLDLSLEKRLKDVGVVWAVHAEKWESNYRLLVKFQQREGHSNVPNSHVEDGMKLGKWLSEQRNQMKKGKLDKSVEKRLKDVGVVWAVHLEEWENNYRLLIKFQQREGHSHVANYHIEDGIRLGYWLCTQRKKKKKGKLDIECEKQLDKIGVVWAFSSRYI